MRGYDLFASIREARFRGNAPRYLGWPVKRSKRRVTGRPAAQS